MISTIESNVKLRGKKLAKIDFLKNVKSNKTLERPKNSDSRDPFSVR